MESSYNKGYVDVFRLGLLMSSAWHPPVAPVPWDVSSRVWFVAGWGRHQHSDGSHEGQ